MQIFDGKAHALLLEERIKQYLAQNPTLTDESAPKLGILQIGENPASKTYVNLKKKFCSAIGIPVEVLSLNDNLNDLEIIT